jgi:PII-like signaling protein
MSLSLLEVFEKHLGHLKFNKSLADKFYIFQSGFISKNEEHMSFFGGNLTGVNVIRFTPTDTNKIFNEILDTDIDDISEDLKNVKDVNTDHIVGSDTFNLTFMYLIHKFLTSEYLADDKKIRAATDAALIFNYRILCGLHTSYFRYPALESTAQATYANLSYKFLLKKIGSWSGVLLFRAEEMINKHGIHYKTFIKFSDDLSIIYAVTDSQGRIRDMLKNIYSEFKKIHDRGDRISTTSGTVIDTDGVEAFKDKSHGLENYTRYILNVMSDKNSFIKKELVEVVLKLMFTTQEKNFIKSLEWLNININNKHNTEVEDFVKLVMVHSYDYLNTESTTLSDTKDLPGFLSRIRGVYLSSRSTDPTLMKMRDIGEEIVKKATGTTNENAMSSIRTSIYLYIVLRAFTKQHYS